MILIDGTSINNLEVFGIEYVSLMTFVVIVIHCIQPS
jgi:hypothetical protein